MTECKNPRSHIVHVALTCGATLTVRHAESTDIPAVLPCSDYIVNGPGGIDLGALVSENDTGDAPWDAFDGTGSFVGEYPDVISGAVAAWNAGPGLGRDSAVCAYSARHFSDNVPAVGVLDCGPVGIVPACQGCGAFYERLRA